jgi:hypothetical protein
MMEQTQAIVNADAWDELLDEETGPAAIVIRERLRPATVRGTPVATTQLSIKLARKCRMR